VTIPDTVTSSTGFADYILLNLRCGSLRARIAVNEFQTMGLALKAGLVDPEVVLEHLHEVGVLDLVIPSSVPIP
jgi:hypothetical protein